MNLSETKKGDLFIISQSILWGLFPVIIVVMSRSGLPPLVSLFFSVLFAAFFFAVVLTLKKQWKELKDTSVWPYLLYLTLLVGVWNYSLYFYALKFTTPGNASLISLLEAFYSFLFFNVWKKEYLSLGHIIGALLMLMGGAIVLFPKTVGFNRGDIYVALGILAAPAHNYLAKKVMKKIGSQTLMFARSLLTLPFVLILIWFFGEKFSLPGFYQSFWLLLINGFLVLGLAKIFWLEGIRRISITKAAALLSVGPLFTLLFAYLLLRQTPTIWQLTAFIPLALGLVLLTYEKSSAKLLTEI